MNNSKGTILDVMSWKFWAFMAVTIAGVALIVALWTGTGTGSSNYTVDDVLPTYNVFERRHTDFQRTFFVAVDAGLTRDQLTEIAREVIGTSQKPPGLVNFYDAPRADISNYIAQYSAGALYIANKSKISP